MANEEASRRSRPSAEGDTVEGPSAGSISGWAAEVSADAAQSPPKQSPPKKPNANSKSGKSGGSQRLKAPADTFTERGLDEKPRSATRKKLPARKGDPSPSPKGTQKRMKAGKDGAAVIESYKK